VETSLPHDGASAPAVPAGAVLLSQRRVYILPTGFGLLFALTVALVLLASINYNLSLGYVLAFLLAGLGLVAMLHTWRNLVQLEVSAGRTEPVFAGDAAVFQVLLVNNAGVARASIRLETAGALATSLDIPARGSSVARLHLGTQRRGWLKLPRIRVYTTYPLGLFRAWSWVELPLRALVWPQPENGDAPLPDRLPGSGEAGAGGRGTDDFAGMRTYQPGDSLRHVAWKALARDGRLVTKQFAGRTGQHLWLDFMLLPRAMGDEARLSRLTRWVLAAEAAGHAYGMRLPDREIAPGEGHPHCNRCLEALALYRLQGPKG
jgi:uncharacterized protein (DUF58 family)